MDEIEKRVLCQLRSRLIKEVVATESFLCAFCDDNILDDQMAKLLQESNYEVRAGKLLDMLPERGSKAFSTFLEILEITNPWLAEKIKAVLHEEKNKDAKINIPNSVSLSASIEGYGQSRLQIDTDIKERAMKFVRAHLNHLTEVEQRGVDKWLADELQRERRRQQFRAPHNGPRHPSDFHASKESQTETTNMDLLELYEEMTIYLHGVDYLQMNVDFSFKKLQQQVKELLTRTRKLDALFLNCLDKFDDVDKYSTPLADLIDRAINTEKSLVQANNDDKRLRQKLVEERDLAKRQVKRLEDELDKILQKQAQILVRPQDIQLRQRQNVHTRYTLLAPDPSDHSRRNNPVDAHPYDHSTSQELSSSGRNQLHYSSGTYNNDETTKNSVMSSSANVHIVHVEEDVENTPKIRRHASEESLKITPSKKDAQITNTTRLNTDVVGNRRRSQDSIIDYDSGHSNSIRQTASSNNSNKVTMPKTTPQRNSRQDLQNRMHRMLAHASSTSPSVRQSSARVRRSESEKAVATHSKSNSMQQQQHGKLKYNDAGGAFKGNPSLRASYDNIVAAGRKGDRIFVTSEGVPVTVTTAAPTSNNRSGSSTSGPQSSSGTNPYKQVHQQHQQNSSGGGGTVLRQSQQQQQRASNNQQSSAAQHLLALQQQRAQQQDQHHQQSHPAPNQALSHYRLIMNQQQEQHYSNTGNHSTQGHRAHQSPQSSHRQQSPGTRNPTQHNPQIKPARGDSRTATSSKAPRLQDSVSRDENGFYYNDYDHEDSSQRKDNMSDSEIVVGNKTKPRAATTSPDRTRGKVRFASPVARTTNPNKKAQQGATSRAPPAASHKQIGISQYQLDPSINAAGRKTFKR